MAYWNAIYHINLYSGSDTARTAIAGVNFVNNGSGVVRGQKTAHGLVTGAVITIPSGTYAGDYMINRIDADNFDVFTARAIGAVIISGTPAVNDTLTLNGNVFTFKASRSGAFDIAISTDLAVLIANICNAVNGDMTTMYAFQQENGFKLLADICGTAGNSYTMAASSTVINLSGATLTGGANLAYSANRTSVSITPFGGASWSDPWLTITTGATAARIQGGDMIKVSKTPDPVAIGNATWTDGSKVVTLATAQTLTVENCEAAWTASTNVTCTTSANRKQGTVCASVVIATAFTTGKVAYKAIGSTLDLSGYQKLSFWIQNTVAVTANYLKICLCSDTTGNTIVDEFLIPAMASTARYAPMTIARTGGGNLGSSIQSIALYAVTDPGTPTLLLDNFIACTTSGLNLQSLISKNGAKQGGTEGFYAIQMIDGATVHLDGDTNCYQSAPWNKYTGATETVTTYMRDGFRTAMAAGSSTSVHTLNDSGSASLGYLEFHGGWDTVTNLQDADTVFDGWNGNGYLVNVGSKTYTKINRLSAVRASSGIYFTSSSNNVVNNLWNVNNNASYGILFTSSSNNTVNNVGNLNNNGSYAIYFSSSSNNTVNNVGNLNNNGSYAIYFSSSNNNTVNNVGNLNNNGSSGINSDAGVNYLKNCIVTQSTEFSSTANPANNWVYSLNHDNVEGNNWMFTYQATVNWQTTTMHNTTGAWKIAITGNTRTTFYPVKVKIAEINHAANKAVTVTNWAMKEHATNLACRLVVYADSVLGITETSDLKASDTNWEELSITFTPTKKGVTEVYLECWYVANTGNIYTGEITATQAP